MVAGMEVVDMEVDIVGDMVATKVFLDQTFLRQSLPRLAHLLKALQVYWENVDVQFLLDFKY